MRVLLAGTVVAVVSLLGLGWSLGWGLLAMLPGATVHQRCGWKAEDYFTDPQVITANNGV